MSQKQNSSKKLPAQALLDRIRERQKEQAVVRQKKHDENVARYKAAVDDYKIMLMEAVNSKLEEMQESGYSWSRLLGIEQVIHDNKTIRDIKVHNLHYGFFSGHWTERNPLSSLDPSIKQPFIEVQAQLAKDGYYLVDMSDPDKSYDVRIALYLEYSRYQEVQTKSLWHNLNKIPTVDAESSKAPPAEEEETSDATETDDEDNAETGDEEVGTAPME